MKNNIRHFFLGMIIAAVPMSFWVISNLSSGNTIVASDSLASVKIKANTKEDKTTLTPTSTATPIPTKKVNKTEAFEIKKPTPTSSAQINRSDENKPTSTKTPTISPSTTTRIPKSKHDALIEKYANQYGANPTIMKRIAKCESGFNPKAISPSGNYYGMYQFVASTWVSNRKAMGLNPDPNLRLNAKEAIKTAAFKMGKDGYGAWPVCSRLAFSN